MVVKDTELPHLRRCVELAAQALEAGDEPFGSVLVGADGSVLAEDHNRVASGDRTRHPEFELARWSAARLTPDERAAATVYTSGEHCPMCAAARVGGPGAHRLRRLVGATGGLAGGVGRTGGTGAAAPGAGGGARRDRGGPGAAAHAGDPRPAPALLRGPRLSRGHPP